METNTPKRFSTALVLLLIIGGAFFFGYQQGASHPSTKLVATELENKEVGKPDKVDFASFWQAWNVINEKFVTAATSTTDQEKVYGAIEGLAKSLGDPYTVFFPPEENKAFETEISGKFEGVGMELGIKDNILSVVAPLKDTPAFRAGIKSGDKIIKINDTLSADMSIEAAVKMIRGPRGTPVTLTIAREGKNEPLEIKIVRDVINIPTIDTEIKKIVASADGDGTTNPWQNEVYVIKLYNFTGNSVNLFREALRGFIASGTHKLVLDLRGNPGGYLDAAVDMASWFLPAGKVVVSEEYAVGTEPTIHRSRGYNIFNDSLKMIILVNEGSASASEILAGALREHNIAKLVGAKTFGKGSVQELVKITPDTSLKLTIARWLTPLGHSISEEGLAPDYEVKITAKDVEAKRDPQMDKAVEILKGM
ncbi:MAG: S41 family peptidase [Candidatus Paceibacterota bacterium]|jgi:carboxyl-terminal processing protease